MTHIIENQYLKADAGNYALIQIIQSKSKKTGETYSREEVFGYYGSIQAALVALVKISTREKIAEGSLRELKDALSYADDLTKQLEAITTH